MSERESGDVARRSDVKGTEESERRHHRKHRTRSRSRSRSRSRERDRGGDGHRSSHRHHRHHHHHHHHHHRGDRHNIEEDDDDRKGRRQESEEERRERKRRKREREQRGSRDDRDEDKERERRRWQRQRQEEGSVEEEERKGTRDGNAEGQRVIDESERAENDGARAGKTTYADVDEERFAETLSNVPTSESLHLQSEAAPSRVADPVLPPESGPTATPLRRDDWMLTGNAAGEEGQNEDGVPSKGAAANGKGGDDDGFFGSLGTYSRTKAPKAEKPNPDDLKVSSRELNSQFAQGKKLDEYEEEEKSERPKGVSTYGGPGHQWRMMKLRRVYEAAEEEGKDVNEIALERYGSLQDFDEARRERQFLDDQQASRGKPMAGRGSGMSSGRSTPTAAAMKRPGAGGYMYTDSPGLLSRPQSRQSFRKPGELPAPSTPLGGPLTGSKRFPPDSAAALETDSGPSSSRSTPKPSTPIPSVFTPTVAARPKSSLATSDAVVTSPPSEEGQGVVERAVEMSEAREADSSKAAVAAVMDPVALNKLSAKVMRAEMSGAPNAAELREKLERETARANGSGGGGGGGDRGQGWNAGDTGPNVQVLPTLDAQGRLYDVGTGRPGDESDRRDAPGNRRKKPDKFETRDKKTGEVLRYNADDDQQTLADLVRQERFGAGRRDQKDMDAELASRIMGDKAYKDDVDYVDDNVERLSRKKVKSDASKREFAIQDFAKTKKALDSCTFCWQDEGERPPRTTVICSGTRCYLALSETEPLTSTHLLIVPIQHHVSSLEADDDTWEEVKNFIKCLMQLAAQSGEALMMWETVKSVRKHKHTFLEVLFTSPEVQDDLRGYFQQAILQSESEWSQHKKLITFTQARPFRRAMVPQLPYFMVTWDHKGERGYGHVIEDGGGKSKHRGGGEDEDQYEDEEEGQEFPAYFAAEVVGNVLDLEPRRWRRPKRMGSHEQQKRLNEFRKRWEPFDWTKMLEQRNQP